MMVDGVVEAPFGAHFTECPPDYGRDEEAQRLYVEAAQDPDAWSRFRAEHVDLSEDDYRRRVVAA
jgi:glutaconate CoA-transferase subunit A